MLYARSTLLHKDEMDEANRLVADFAARDGPAVQAALADRDRRKYSSFITAPWFEMYLSDRRPVLLNHNPALIFKDEEGAGRTGEGSQVGRAARLIHAALTFDRTISTGHLEPDIFHTQPKKSKTSTFNEVVRLLPRSISFYGAAICGAYPLDMSQYSNLLRSTRIPKPGIDELVVSPGSRHIVIQRNGTFYKLDVLTADGGTVPLAQLTARSNRSLIKPTRRPLRRMRLLVYSLVLIAIAGAHYVRKLSTSDPANAESLAVRCSWETHEPCFSLFADLQNLLARLSPWTDDRLGDFNDEPRDRIPPDDEPGQGTTCTPFFLHGSGTDRWLDKSFQLILASNGQVSVLLCVRALLRAAGSLSLTPFLLSLSHTNKQTALNFEHSWGDGVAVMRFVNEVYEASSSLPLISSPQQPSSAPSRLSFKLDGELKKAVRDAVQFDKTIKRTEIANLRSEGFNSVEVSGSSTSSSLPQLLTSSSLSPLSRRSLLRPQLKKLKLSPDGAMQMAFQLAHHKMRGGLLPSTYEAASTAAFKHGRLSRRPSARRRPRRLSLSSPRSRKALSASASEKAGLMRKAIDNHTRISRDALMGNGFDLTLRARRRRQIDGEEPAAIRLFGDQEAAADHPLDVDALVGHYCWGGFGPVNDDCYAVGYGILGRTARRCR